MRSDGTGTSTWSYNSLGELWKMVSPQGEVQYEYSVAGELTKLKDMGSGGSHQDITYEYGAATGRLRKILSPNNEATWFDYDANGQLAKKRLASGLDEVYAYDSLDRLYSTTIKNHSTNATLHSLTYTYDDASRVTGLSEYDSAAGTTVGTTYGYDGYDRLTSESRTGYTATYTYDTNDNRLTKAITGGSTEVYVYDRGDKLTDVSVNGSYTKQFTYDTDGRLYTANVGGNTSVYSWSEDSRLTHIDLPGTTNDPSYAYNGAGTRVSKTVSSTASSWKRAGAGVTSPVIADSGATYVPGISERRSSTTTYAHSGIKNEFAQSSTTSLAATRTYDAFGATTASTGTWSGTFGYAGAFGYQEDSDSGLKLLGNRYYDDSLGRFISRDPIKDGNNWYSYCGGNPVSKSDASGLHGKDNSILRGQVFNWSGYDVDILFDLSKDDKTTAYYSKIPARAASTFEDVDWVNDGTGTWHHISGPVLALPRWVDYLWCPDDIIGDWIKGPPKPIFLMGVDWMFQQSDDIPKSMGGGRKLKMYQGGDDSYGITIDFGDDWNLLGGRQHKVTSMRSVID